MTEKNYTDAEKLQMLLSHWLEHNKSHSAEYLKWAEVARQDGKTAAAELIEQGLVKLNGVVVKEPGCAVDPEKDKVLYRDRGVHAEVKEYFVFHKPINVITTTKDEKGGAHVPPGRINHRSNRRRVPKTPHQPGGPGKSNTHKACKKTPPQAGPSAHGHRTRRRSTDAGHKKDDAGNPRRQRRSHKKERRNPQTPKGNSGRQHSMPPLYGVPVVRAGTSTEATLAPNGDPT